MKDLAIFKVISSAVARTKFTLQKNSPEIFLATGIIGGIGCVVLTGIASTKVLAIIEEGKEEIATVKGERDENVINGSVILEPEEVTQNVARAYVHTGLRIAKLYLPAASVGMLAIGGTLMSHKIITKRNAAVSSALLLVTEGFKEYRERVKDRFGEEVETDIRYGLKDQKIDKVVTDESTGKEKKVKESIKVVNGAGSVSDYARYFDSTCSAWDKNDSYNRMFLSAQQSYANDKLRADKYLFLNDVYEMLGLEKTEAGQIVGWVFDPSTPIGDNYIEIKQIDIHREIIENGEKKYEKVLVLDFNVDGNIWSLNPFAKQ